MVNWRPSATAPVLQLRAALLARSRGFFAARNVMEVDTPLVINAAVTDVHIESARVEFAAGSAGPFFLHTSPEYAMKRLLAAGAGDIYQICHVVRGLERGRQHNAEFTLIEWYRCGFTLDALMCEVEALVRCLLAEVASGWTSERVTYRNIFLRELRIDPLECADAELAAAARAVGFNGSVGNRDELLELLMATAIGPRLGRDALTFVHGYPATQAALARLDPTDPRTARRFELYCQGVELANGFHELTGAAEQRARFERDNAERQSLGMPVFGIDERLLAALEAGMPDSTGVALGFDRTLMLAARAQSIDAVLAFPIEHA